MFLFILFFFLIYGIVAFIRDRKEDFDNRKKLNEEQHKILEYLEKNNKIKNSVKEE